MSIEIIKERLVLTFTQIPELQDEAWRIRYNDQWVKLKSGKDVWKRKHHAKSAFKNHINRHIRWNLNNNTYQMFGVDLCDVTGKHGRFNNEIINRLVDMLVENGVLEFVRIN